MSEVFVTFFIKRLEIKKNIIIRIRDASNGKKIKEIFTKSLLWSYRKMIGKMAKKIGWRIRFFFIDYLFFIKYRVRFEFFISDLLVIL